MLKFLYLNPLIDFNISYFTSNNILIYMNVYNYIYQSFCYCILSFYLPIDKYSFINLIQQIS